MRYSTHFIKKQLNEIPCGSSMLLLSSLRIEEIVKYSFKPLSRKIQKFYNPPQLLPKGEMENMHEFYIIFSKGSALTVFISSQLRPPFPTYISGHLKEPRSSAPSPPPPSPLTSQVICRRPVAPPLFQTYIPGHLQETRSSAPLPNLHPRSFAGDP